jgi:hypothetical protein
MKPIIRAGLIVESRAAAHTRTKRMHACMVDGPERGEENEEY